jgi:hypothetical protein
MRSLAARSAVQHNIFAVVEDICDLGEIGVVRPRDWPRNVHRIGDVVIHDRGGDIRRHDQNGNTAFRQGRLGGEAITVFRRACWIMSQKTLQSL